MIVLSIIVLNPAYSQVDTIVIADLREIMIIDSEAITNSMSDDITKNTGFFMDKSFEGALKICNESDTYIWANGRLKDMFSSCKLLSFQDLSQDSGDDTLYISLYSGKGTESITCEHVIFNALPVEKEDYKKKREIRKVTEEFLIISILLISLCFGWTMTTSPSRLSYIFKKSFSLKLSSYEFVSTSFLNQSNFQFLLLLSLVIGLLLVSGSFINHGEVNSLGEIVWKWLGTSALICFLLGIKWIFAGLISLLFRYKKMNDFQLFDFQNFLFLSFSLISLFHFIGFVIYQPLQMVIQGHIEGVILLVLSAYLVWSGIKFIHHSTGGKLQIISYLCTTEIIPVVLFYIKAL